MGDSHRLKAMTRKEERHISRRVARARELRVFGTKWETSMSIERKCLWQAHWDLRKGLGRGSSCLQEDILIQGRGLKKMAGPGNRRL